MNKLILNEVSKYSAYSDIYKFMDYLIENYSDDKQSLINDLMLLSENFSQESIHYFILTDIIDYLIGFHGKFDENSKEAIFINIMNNS